MYSVPIRITLLNFEGDITLTHQPFSVLCILNGDCSASNSSHISRLHATDVLTVTEEETVTLIPTASVLMLRMEIPEHVLIGALGTAGSRIRFNSALHKGFSQAYRQYMRVAEAYFSKDGNQQLHLYAQVLELLYILDSASQLYLSEESAGKGESGDRRAEIEQYIQLHAQDNLTLDMVAEHLHVSTQYCSRLFKRLFGKNFVAYLHEVRVRFAARSLLASDAAVTTIAFDAGFSSLSVFQDAFRKYYGMTPKEYRASHSKDHAGESADTLAGYTLSSTDTGLIFNAYLSQENLPLSDSGRQILLDPTVHLGDAVPISGTWNDIINIGPAISCLNSVLQAQLREARENIGFRYVRMLDLISRDVFPSGFDARNPNYMIYDRIINFILSIGMRPMFDLGPRPIRNISGGGHQTVFEPVILQIKELEDFLRQLLLHSVNNWSYETVSQWRIENWLPQTDSGMIFKHAPAQYSEYSAAIQRTAKSVVPDIEVGFLGLNVNLASPEMAQATLQALKQAVPDIDFLSISVTPTYEYDTEEAESADMQQLDRARYKAEYGIAILPDRSFNADTISEKLAKITRLYHSVFPNLKKIYITELSSDATSRLHFNDSCYCAAFLVKTILENFRKVDGIGCWVLSDLLHEDYASSRALFGGNGLFSRDGLKKPAFYAFTLLNRLGSHLLYQSDNLIITGNGKERYQVIVHNFKHLRMETYSAFAERILPLSAVEAEIVYMDRLQMNFRMTMEGVPSGTYFVRRHKLTEQDSLLNVLNELNARVLHPDDLNYLNGRCSPRQHVSYLECRGSIVLHTTLSPNEIAMFELTRLI